MEKSTEGIHGGFRIIWAASECIGIFVGSGFGG